MSGIWVIFVLEASKALQNHQQTWSSGANLWFLMAARPRPWEFKLRRSAAEGWVGRSVPCFCFTVFVYFKPKNMFALNPFLIKGELPKHIHVRGSGWGCLIAFESLSCR